MNEIAKVFSSLLLLGAGFIGASMFGPPDLVDQFAAQWKATPKDDPQALRPLEAGVPNAPSQLSMRVAQAKPINDAQYNNAQSKPIRQLASHANVPQQDSNGGHVAQKVTTLWNDQTQVEPTHRASDDWLNAIHNSSNPTLNRVPNLKDLPANSKAMSVASVDVTSPDAWSVPSWDGSNRYASQSTPLDSSNQLLSPPSFAADEVTAPVSDPTVSNLIDDSFQSRPLVGPQNNQPIAVRENDASTDQNETNFYGSSRYESSLYEPSPFGEIEAPSVQRINLPAGPERTHVVTDGDTLPLLAERYLGDAGRAQELYELNRDRLQHPDLLPIGIILRTPQAPARRTEVKSNASSNYTSQPYTAAWRGDAEAGTLTNSHANSPNPYSTVSEAANSANTNSLNGGNHRQSQLVPLGQSAELPAAPAPTSVYQQDWSW